MRPARSGVGGSDSAGFPRSNVFLSGGCPQSRRDLLSVATRSKRNRARKPPGSAVPPPSGLVPPPAPNPGALGAAGEVPKPLSSLLRERPARCVF